MKFHPMDVNTNTRVRWEQLKGLPEIKTLNGKKVLEVGCGLGYFSTRFVELGAKVKAIDIDKDAIDYLAMKYNIETQYVNVEKDRLPKGNFDLIFIGEILEHIKEPYELLRKTKEVLATSGVIVVTTPALEGFLIHTKGKKLGHNKGVEKHERDGFYLSELEKLFSQLGMKVTHHSFSVFILSELFMQLTKISYLKKKNKYDGQSDIIDLLDSYKYKTLRFVYPLLLIFFKIEHFLCNTLRFKGHCHILIARTV